jgi:hypothetical protein
MLFCNMSDAHTVVKNVYNSYSLFFLGIVLYFK